MAGFGASFALPFGGSSGSGGTLIAVDGGLACPLAFPLGGSVPGLPPRVINLYPELDALDVGLLDPVRMSLRDLESNIDPASIVIALGFAKAHARGEAPFDESIARTVRGSLRRGTLVNDPEILIIPDGVQIRKTSAEPQRSVYLTTVDTGSGFPSAMMSCRVRPDTISQGSDIGGSPQGPLNYAVMPGVLPLPFINASSVRTFGTVLGLEYGPRNTGVYVYLQSDGVHRVRITGPNVNGVVAPDVTVTFEWNLFHRYLIVWNEAIGKVEVFANTRNSIPFSFFTTTKLASIPISSFQQLNPHIGTPTFGSSGTVVGIYGQEGENNDKCTISNVAVTTDVHFPFLSGGRPATFISAMNSDERISFENEDPRTRPVSSWFDVEASLFSPIDPAGSMSYVKSTGAFRITKNTLGNCIGIYREETALKRSRQGGIYFKVKFFGTTTTLDGSGAGMGFILWDGHTAFEFDLFDDTGLRTVGLLKRGGSAVRPVDHFMPPVAIDWSSPVTATIVLDPSRVGPVIDAVRVEIFLTDPNVPVYSAVIPRTQLPDAAQLGLLDVLGDPIEPFIAFGHLRPTNTRGSLDIYNAEYSTIFESWVATDGYLPDNAEFTKPTWPLEPGAAGTEVLASGVEGQELVLTCAPGQQRTFLRKTGPSEPALHTPDFGLTLEARLKISSYKPRSRSGVYVLSDDGNKSMFLSFVDTDIGRFVCMPISAGINGYKEVVGLDGIGAKFSFRLDWTTYHTYRLERRPHQGISIFVDAELTPRLVISEANMAQLPTSQFGSPSIGFGQYSVIEGAISNWKHVRVRRGAGFELSMRRNAPQALLKEEVFGSQTLVSVTLLDTDV